MMKEKPTNHALLTW